MLARKAEAKMASIFISHTHGDKEISDALKKLINQLFGDAVQVHASTGQEDDGGIKTGDDWNQWIVDRVSKCDIAFVLLTPGSIQKPWILWEGGLITGVAAANKEQNKRKVRPLVFGVDRDNIPSPFLNIQHVSGDAPESLKAFFRDLVTQFANDQKIPTEKIVSASSKINDVVDIFVELVEEILLRAPIPITEAAVQEWLIRLDKFDARPSEVEQFDLWMKIAFGRENEKNERPLDLRLHRRLGELYISAGDHASLFNAVKQFEMARRLAPRDIFILRQLAGVYIDIGDLDHADKIVAFISSIDEEGLTGSSETAALIGKLSRKKGHPGEAVKILHAALIKNPKSYYLANLAAEASLEDNELEKAADYYTTALSIIDKLQEQNIWSEATAMNSLIANKKFPEALMRAERIAAFGPNSNEIGSIRSGISTLQEAFKISDKFLYSIEQTLAGKEFG